MENAVPVVPAVPDDKSYRLARLVVERDRVMATIERSCQSEAEYQGKLLHLWTVRDALRKELDDLNLAICALGGGTDRRGSRYYEPRQVIVQHGIHQQIEDSH